MLSDIIASQSAPAQVGRLSPPKVVQIRYAAKTGKYKLGNDWVRDPARVQVVRELREEATKRAEGAQPLS